MSSALYYGIYHRSETTATWIPDFVVFQWHPEPWLTFALWSALAVAAFIALEIFFRVQKDARQLVYGGILLAWAIPLVSQFVASSVTKLVYEATFCFVGIGSYTLGVLLPARSTERGAHPARSAMVPWRVLASGAKVSLALLALLAGTIATTVVSAFSDPMDRSMQVGRQIVLLLYAVLGLTVLAFPPFAIAALEAGRRRPHRRRRHFRRA